MPISRLFPDRFDVATVAEDTVDGRLAETVTIVDRDVPGRLLPRAPDDVLYDPAGKVVADADVLTHYPLGLGHAILIGDARHTVTGVGQTRRDARRIRFYSAPVRTG